MIVELLKSAEWAIWLAVAWSLGAVLAAVL